MILPRATAAVARARKEVPMSYQLKRLPRDGVPGALAKAER